MRILMYHGITGEDPQEIHTVSRHRFAAQMRWLRQAGYQTMWIEDWLAARDSAGPALPQKAIALTFDDGYLDNYTHALPILLEHDFRATIFLVSGLMGQTSRWQESRLAQIPLLTWAQAREMAEQSIRFGSHTTTHPDLTGVDARSVEQELSQSRAHIEQMLGQPVKTFSYPYSRFTPQVKALVRESGYQLACTYRPGYVGQAGQDPFELQRVGILATDTLDDFAGKVRNSLRWRVGWYRRVLGGWQRRVASRRNNRRDEG